MDGFTRRRRHLPHWEEPGATYFITPTLRRPAAVDLTRPDLGPIIVGALLFHDEKRYWLYDYTVMPNHAHAILKPIDRDGKCEPLWRITHSLKSWSAQEINRLVGRQGSLWEEETYSRILRDGREYQERAKYILDNPHTAGLIEDPTEWPWWGRGSGRLLA